MFTVVANADQLRKALKDIEQAEANGFMHCQAVFHLKTYGSFISQCVIEYDDLVERGHPSDLSLNWGRGQDVTKKCKLIDGKLVRKQQ